MGGFFFLAWILRTYAIREVVSPTLLSLLLLTFIFIIGQIYDLIDLVLQPGVRLTHVLDILVSFVPSILVFVAPMAVLIGVLVGVGRMTLDREVLAIRASGINLFGVYLPLLALALLISLGIMLLAGGLVPNMMVRGMRHVSELQFEVITSLPAGQFHESENLGSSKGDLSIYFAERDEETRQMKKVLIKIDREFDSEGLAKDLLEKRELERRNRETALAPPGSAADEGRPADAPQRSGEETAPAPDPLEEINIRDKLMTLIVAETGEIKTGLRRGEEAGEGPTAAIMLTLRNGHFQQYAPDDRDFLSLRFKRLRKLLFADPKIKKRHKTRTSKELREFIADKDNKKHRGLAHKEYVQRQAVSLAFFAFALIGVPLAIWIRPSGKSWGILLAIGLMLIYYVLMQWGLSLVEEERAFGVAVAFLPNILFSVIGAFLWWHMLRS